MSIRNWALAGGVIAAAAVAGVATSQQPPPSPVAATQVSLPLITGVGFTDNRLGAASAASVLLFIVIVAIAIIRQLVERAAAKREMGA